MPLDFKLSTSNLAAWKLYSLREFAGRRFAGVIPTLVLENITIYRLLRADEYRCENTDILFFDYRSKQYVIDLSPIESKSLQPLRCGDIVSVKIYSRLLGLQ